MAFQVTSDTTFFRDDKEILRQLSYSRLYSLTESEMLLSLQELADRYLDEATDFFEFPSQATLFTPPGEKMGQVAINRVFKEEKSVENSAVVSFGQVILGHQVWRSGVSVRMDKSKIGITGVHNAMHYNIELQLSPEHSTFLPGHLANDIGEIENILGIAADSNLRVNGVSTLIYQYTTENRFDVQFDEDDSDKQQPLLPLSPVDDAIIEGRHYIVTELLFTYPLEQWGKLNWRAFIEQATGTVLYLRALVACANADVFVNTCKQGDFNRLSASADLKKCIEKVTLQGLIKPVGSKQELEGELVKLVEYDPPTVPFPSMSSSYYFSYNYDTRDFASCSAYYHCDNMFRLMMQMGIDLKEYFDNTDFPISIDPHTAEINAYAHGNVAGNGIQNIAFGIMEEGSTMGICADPRIVIHEFSHALLLDHVSSCSFGFAHSPGDVLAAILQDPYSKASDRFATFPFLKSVGKLDKRRLDREVAQGWAWFGKKYNRGYRGEEILSTTLFRVYRAAGGDSYDMTEKEFASFYIVFLIFKAIGLLSFTTPHPEVFVAALTEAALTTGFLGVHPGGVCHKLFRWSFERQGLYRNDLSIDGPGAPPDIDVYIDDGRNGGYIPYLCDHEHCTQIWNRTTQDGLLGNEFPKTHVSNYAYVCIGNRGQLTATDITVRCYQSKVSQPLNWPSDWILVSEKVTQNLPSGQTIVVGAFEWTPQSNEDSLLFSISSPGDRSNIELISSGAISSKRLVVMDNNIAIRNFTQ